MEHRFEANAPSGWLAGAWWSGEAQFCRWEYDLANRLLFVDLDDQVCIESLDVNEVGRDPRAELPSIAMRFATKTARENGKPVHVNADNDIPTLSDRQRPKPFGRTYTTLSTSNRRRV